MQSIRSKHNEALVVAFGSTASALAFGSAAKTDGLPGRLFPIPRSLSAGCGIAWRGEPATRGAVESLIEVEGIDDAQIVIMELR